MKKNKRSQSLRITPSNRIFSPQANQAALLVIDIQDKLIAAMPVDAAEAVLKNAAILIQGCQALNVPVMVTEQYPKGLGKTHMDLLSHLGNAPFYEKLSFSSYRHPQFRLELERLHVQHVLLCGIETHVCVLQTALELLENGFQVFAAADTMCSRASFNHQNGLQLLRDAGAVVGSTETFLFQMLKEAGTEPFKRISKLVK
jgi:nicotinamidase-related amidase